MSWFNNDGLLVKFGTEKTVPNLAGEYKTTGALREIELKINLTALTSSQVIQSDQTFVPANAKIEEVELVATTAATSGGAPTLDVGMIQTDRTTIVSNTGFTAAVALATLTPIGAKQVLRPGSAGAGAFVGTTVGTLPGYIVARANAATYTAGVLLVRIRYRLPS